MQQKEQNISPIKQRILQFANNLGMSKREFYAKIGVSRGTLEAKTGITEDILVKFIATFPEISLDWLLLDHGPMTREDQLHIMPDEARTPVEVIHRRSNPHDIERITHLEELLEAKNEALEAKSESLAAKDIALAAKDETIATCRKANADKDKAIADQEIILRKCFEEDEAKKRRIAGLEGEITRLRLDPTAKKASGPTFSVGLGDAPDAEKF